MNYNGSPIATGKNVPVYEFSFTSLLDETCERLLDRQVKYSILKIHELEKRLIGLERELDEFLQMRR